MVDARRWSLTVELGVCTTVGARVGLRAVRLSSDVEGEGTAGGTRPRVLLRRRRRKAFETPSLTAAHRGEEGKGKPWA